jgi:hypothetical protein
MTTPDGPDRDRQLGAEEHRPVAEGTPELTSMTAIRDLSTAASSAPRHDFLGMPRSYVTEVSVPCFGDGGVQRLYAPVKQSEYEHVTERPQLPTRADLDQPPP